MDDKAFDRLSVMVHRLRDQATRRGALKVLFGGAVAAAGGLLADETDAKKRHKKKHKHKNKKHRSQNCRGFGGFCYSHRDCCSGNCIGNRCFAGNGRGGRNCGGRTCPNGWGCCRSGAVSVCTPNNFPTCCGNAGFAPGFNCCDGFSGGACPGGFGCTGQFGLCCQPGWSWCSNSGRCCPNGWFCGDIACEAFQSADVARESVETVPYADPVRIGDGDWIPLEP
jgi:hypothetical protein